MPHFRTGWSDSWLRTCARMGRVGRDLPTASVSARSNGRTRVGVLRIRQDEVLVGLAGMLYAATHGLTSNASNVSRCEALD